MCRGIGKRERGKGKGNRAGRRPFPPSLFPFPFSPQYGAEGDRTPDLCIANAALSQLSYRPFSGSGTAKLIARSPHGQTRKPNPHKCIER